MEGSHLYIRSWSAAIARAPEADVELLGACTEYDAIPAGIRRRLDPYGRMAVACGLGALSKCTDADIVFSSRYGNMPLTYGLLRDLSAGEPLSPAAFSMSVHNAAPGALDLIRKKQTGHTAISSGNGTLSVALCEASARLTECPDTPVLVLYTEVLLPAPFAPLAAPQMGAVAFAMLLSVQWHGSGDALLSRARAAQNGTALRNPSSEALAGALIGALRERTGSEFRWEADGLSWTIQVGCHAED